MPVVDACVGYDCPTTGETCILLFCNALYVPAMEHNLVPPFIMHEAGIVVNDVPKIHVADPDVKDHTLYFPEVDFTIPLCLHGIFSYFQCRCPTREELQNADVLVMTPDCNSWNPHLDLWMRNEEAMVDWEGNVLDKEQRILVEDIIPSECDVAHVSISATEGKAVDTAAASSATLFPISPVNNISSHPSKCQNEVATMLGDISPALDKDVFAARVLERGQDGAFMMSVGATSVDSDLDDELVLFTSETWLDTDIR